jgi:hypothetical protein
VVVGIIAATVGVTVVTGATVGVVTGVGATYAAGVVTGAATEAGLGTLLAGAAFELLIAVDQKCQPPELMASACDELTRRTMAKELRISSLIAAIANLLFDFRESPPWRSIPPAALRP